MSDLPSKIAERRILEDRALVLGNEWEALTERRANLIEQAVQLMEIADPAGIPIDQLAELLKVDRTTLYRWRRLYQRNS